MKGTDSRRSFRGVRQFYVAAFEYIVAKFPLRDEVLQHAKFVDLEKQQSCRFRWCQLLHGSLSNCIWLQFKWQWQSLWWVCWVSTTSPRQYSTVLVRSGLRKNGRLRFSFCSNGCTLGLSWFHEDWWWVQVEISAPFTNCEDCSSAAEERVFSLVRLNKTPYRSSLSLNGTLSSILTVKLHNPEAMYWLHC